MKGVKGLKIPFQGAKLDPSFITVMLGVSFNYSGSVAGWGEREGRCSCQPLGPRAHRALNHTCLSPTGAFRWQQAKPSQIMGGTFSYTPPASASTRQPPHQAPMGPRRMGLCEPPRAVRSRDRNMARTAAGGKGAALKWARPRRSAACTRGIQRHCFPGGTHRSPLAVTLYRSGCSSSPM
ncbi:hypothetical protein NDU88_008330 [Pleurodeles waltl]|uniref:Uncharacterized protein n=1 Tax=Pleurodeles waltl TaxID=8319 RepID=A0AAV7P4R7_PLEWA|nr:hypothetical protein NDU88_008330 [Pleurodeles waltl]